jgi:hypothetical protein
VTSTTREESELGVQPKWITKLLSMEKYSLDVSGGHPEARGHGKIWLFLVTEQ